MTSWLCKGIPAALLMATLAAGCGSSDDGADNFIGIWNYTTGTETITCNGMNTTDPLKGNITIGHGVDAPLVMVFDPCNQGLKMNVTGPSATIIPGQMCNQQGTATDGAGNPISISITLIFNAGSFTVTGATANISAGGIANIIANGSTIPCTFTQTGTANKVSK